MHTNPEHLANPLLRRLTELERVVKRLARRSGNTAALEARLDAIEARLDALEGP